MKKAAIDKLNALAAAWAAEAGEGGTAPSYFDPKEDVYYIWDATAVVIEWTDERTYSLSHFMPTPTVTLCVNNGTLDEVLKVLQFGHELNKAII